MFLRRAILVSLSFLGVSNAFFDTVPFVAWSSHDSSTSRRISACHAGQLNNTSPLHEVLQGDDVCDYDAIVLMEYPGLHASDLRSLSRSSQLGESVNHASYSAQLPYVRAAVVDMPALSESLSNSCGASLVQAGPESHLPQLGESKHVIYIRLPEVSGEGVWRRDVVAEHESIISQHVSAVEAFSRKSLFLLMGSPASELSKRQLDIPIETPAAFAPSDSSSTGGILANYQLLTPGLILALLVVFFVLAPILIASINVLTSIQSSIRLDGPKIVGQDKKNQ